MRARTLSLALVVLLVTQTVAAPAARTWTDGQGRPFRATFVRIHGGDVILSRGGRVARIPVASLAPDDLEYVREQLKAKGQEHRLPSTPDRPPPPDALAPTIPLPALRPKGWDPAETTPSEAAQPAKPTVPQRGPEPIRTWTDLDGHTIQAQLLEFSGDMVVLRKDGDTVSYPLSVFSEADQAYVRERTGRDAKPATTGEAPDPPGIYAPHYGGPAEHPSHGGHEIPHFGPMHGAPQSTAKQHPAHGHSAGETAPGRSAGNSPPAGSRPSTDESAGIPHQSSIGPPHMSPPGNPSPKAPYMPGAHRPASFPGGSRPEPEGISHGSPPAVDHVPAEQVQVYACSNCNKDVPAHLGAGDRCPHCGVRWDYEETADGRMLDSSGREVSKAWIRMGGAGGLVAIVVFLVSLVIRLARNRD